LGFSPQNRITNGHWLALCVNEIDDLPAAVNGK
jgi:hypothetical protein